MHSNIKNMVYAVGTITHSFGEAEPTPFEKSVA
jgi:hypothetical protein